MQFINGITSATVTHQTPRLTYTATRFISSLTTTKTRPRITIGTIPFIPFTTKGVEPVQTLNPFALQEAETINQCQGVRCEGDYNGCYVTNTSRGGQIKVRNVDFGITDAKLFKARIKSEKNVTISIRTGSSSGTVKGRLATGVTNGEWMDLSCELSEPIKGIQDLFFTISGSPSSEFKFDNWQFFEESTGIHTPNTTRRVSNVYDLQGRKTKNKPAHHSIQIVDGKKVIQ